MTIVTKWIKTGAVHDFVFVGKDVIATASGNHVIFHNLVSNEKRIEYFNSPTRGQGACCLSGHPVTSMFSTSERCYKPKIYIHTYPDIRKVAVCRLDKGPNSYLSCCFAGTEYLLSLTSFPNFQLIVWLWRTGERIAYTDTMLKDGIQIIEASLLSAHLIYQFSPTSGKLWTYEIYTYSRKIAIVKNSIKSIQNQISSVCWTNNGNLLLCDVYQNVYIVSSDGKKYAIILRGDEDVVMKKSIFVLPFLNGFVMLDNNSQLSYYNKSLLEINSSDVCNVTWCVRCPSHPVKMTLARNKAAIFINTDIGSILELSLQDNKPRIEEISKSCLKFLQICVINPQECHAVALDSSNRLNLIDVLDGNVCTYTEIDSNDEVLCIAAHPHIPLLVFGTTSGKCNILSVSTKNLDTLKMIYLHKNPLKQLKFSKNGSLFGVVSTDPNRIFLLRTVAEADINVFFHTTLIKPVVDFLIVETQETVQLLILAKTHSIAPVGDLIEIYLVNKWENSFRKSHKINLHAHYQNLKYGLESVCDFFCLPYLSKQLHLFNIENESIILIDALSSEHKVRKFHVNVYKNSVITSGFDGLVIVRNSTKLSKCQNSFTIHNYQEKGTKQSLMAVKGKLIISLGGNGSLVCFKNSESNEVDEADRTVNIESLKWENINSETTIYNNKTWIELEEEKAIEKDRNESLHLKNIILNDLNNLKIKIKSLLDSNERKSFECKLPTSTFNINIEKRNEKVSSAVREQEETRVSLQNKISEKEEIIEYLMNSFWNTFETHDCTLTSFNCKIYVNNFRIRCVENPEKMDDFSIELFNTPLLSLCKETSKYIEDKSTPEPISIDDILEKSNENQDFLYLKCGNDIVFTGSTSFQWIKDDMPPNQFSKTTFHENYHDIDTSRVNKLKIHFNEKFNEMKSLKNHVLIELEGRLRRLRKCKQELKEVFGIFSENDKFGNIKWHSTEMLEDVILIKPEEISVEYQTDICSNNEVIETVINSEQRKSINMDNSDSNFVFRSEKLQEMMDGLLEIRWEDEIRKEVPKPECLSLKSPSRYNKNEITEVEVYKQKLAKLDAQRQKYKTYLEAEIQNINEQINADIKNFDRKMEEFALEKIKVKSAILQEFLLRLNDQKRQLLQDYGNKRISNIVNYDLVILENEYRASLNEVTSAEPTVIDLRNKYENLNKRDKVLEGKFRGEFEELKQPMVEHLLRQYKRRPRIGQITCTSLTYLAETNKCLIAGKKSAILPKEYLDFLRGMDALDVMPSSLPPQIDAGHWQSLCKLRRNKVEIEIKLRIAALELAEAEQTLFYLQKLSSSAQSKVYFMRNNVEEETMNQSKFLKNLEIQLVLKSAQIEILTTGNINNFENTAVVTCEQLVNVNNEIIAEGEKKIAAMRALIKLKKSMLYRGWKYQCMLKKMKHLKEHLAILQKTKIGKEMQNYLVERLGEKIQYKDATSCDKMLKSVERKFQRTLNVERKKLSKMLEEMKYWSKMNVESLSSIEILSLKKQEQSEQLEEDHLRKRNRIFHKNHLRSIMERTRLVEAARESRNELTNLQTQLELLKLKTYPTLRCKNASYYRKSIRKKRN